MSGPVPMPELTYDFGSMAGPATASSTGDVGELGSMTVGDYYARGSRVRQGSGWQEYGALGLVALTGLAGLGLWWWMNR